MKFQNVDLTKGENRTPEFLAMNPHHTIPVRVQLAAVSAATVAYMLPGYQRRRWYDRL